MCDCPALIDRVKRRLRHATRVFDVVGDRPVTRKGGDFFPSPAPFQVARQLAG